MSSVSIDRLAAARKTVVGAVFIVVSSSLLSAGVARSTQPVAFLVPVSNTTSATALDWKMIARRTFRRQQCAILGEDWCGGRAH
jgi:hypothetical protein